MMKMDINEYWNVRKNLFAREITIDLNDADKEELKKFLSIEKFDGELEKQMEIAENHKIKTLMQELITKTISRYKEENDDEFIRNLSYLADGMEKNKIKEVITDELIKKYNICTMSDTEEIYAYNETTGLYEPSEIYLKKQIQRLMDKAQLGKEVSSHFVKETLEHIRRKTYIKRDEFEAPPYYIPLENCVVDIRPDGDGTRSYSSDLKFLSKLPIKYDENAKCPHFDAFLSEVLEDDLTIGTMYQIIGYMFYRAYPIQRAFMFVGEGANGKSTLLNVFEKLLGNKNVSHLSLQQIEYEKFSINALHTKYANIYADLSSQELKSTGRFKALTGGDTLEVEKKFGGTYALVNHAKLIFSCNQIPKTGDDADAFFRRWIIIPFRTTFIEGKNARANVLNELITEEEKSGIFNKSIIFLLQLLREGKFIGDWNIEKMRETYTRLSDSVASFSMDRLEPSTNYITKEELWNEYARYCNECKIPLVSEKTFFIRLNKLFRLEEQRITLCGIRKRVLNGIKFKEPDHIVV